MIGGGALKRQFVAAGGREVHCLLGGSGPVALLLPAFPDSCVSLAPLAEFLADDFTVVALDLAGYGNSHPMEGSPDIAAYADSVIEAADALGVGRFLLYGVGTGAQVALEVALRHRERVAFLICDGLAIYDADERLDLKANYCPSFAPSWDGAHIAAIWTWCRDQVLFSPWYRQSPATRIDADEPPASEMHRRAVDVLRAGDGYSKGLMAAFAHRTERLADLEVPHALVGTVATGQSRSPTSEALVDSGESSLWQRLRSLLAAATGADCSLSAPRQAPAEGRVNRSYVQTGKCQVLCRRIPGVGRPLVMLHASPTSSALLEPLMAALGDGRPVVAFDTPGNGDSEPPGCEEAHIGDFASILNEAIDCLGLDSFDLYGTHTGALIAMEISLVNPGVRRMILEGVTLFDDGGRDDLLARSDLLESYLPRFEPTWDGTHLMAAWHFRRSFTLYWPWYWRSRSGIRRVPPVPLGAFQRSFTETLKSLETYHLPYRAALAYPTAERLVRITVPTLIAAHPDDPLAAHTTEASGLAADARGAELPDDLGGVAALYEDFLRA